MSLSGKSLNFEKSCLEAYKFLDMSVFIKDVKSQYLWANDFFIKKASGFLSVNEIITKDDHAFCWNDYADELRANDRELFESKQPSTFRERTLRCDNNHMDLISQKCPLFDNNKLIGLIGFSIAIPVSKTIRLLSKREYSSVLLMSEGYSDKEIARKLEISPRTVETHINNAKNKLNLASRAELIVEISRHPP